ncbi:hypothetical protein DICPUDRAFT_20587, partial [Dictyostelium purpureum]
IPEDLQVLVFLDGFNETIKEDFIGPRVTTLHFFDILKPLEPKKSIPSTVKNIYFENGFNQPLSSDVVPDSVKEIHFFDIKSTLTQESFSKSSKLNTVYLENGFGQVLEDGILPPTSTIRINNISQPLSKGSIPDGTEYVVFENGYSHEIVEGVVPSTTVQLVFKDIKKPLVQGSIP